MKNTRLLASGLLLLCIIQAGCVQLKEVHAFTETCQTTLDKDVQISYGYVDYCQDSCYIFNVSGRQLADFDCNCQNDEGYDTVIKKEYNILSAYFCALGKLAGTQSKINFAPIATAIQAGTYGNMVVTTEESTVVSTLATVATDLLTTKYKSKKIREILVRYNDTLAIAMELLKLHIDNLKSRIELMRTKIQQRCDLLMANNLTDAEKWSTVYIYKQKRKELAAIISSYDKRYGSLDKIKQGHSTLYANVNDLNSATLKKKVIDLASDIIYFNNN